MGLPMALTVAGGLFSAASSVMAGQAQARAYEAQAKMAEYNARAAERQGVEALIKSSPYLTPADAAKLRGSIGPKAEIYRRQEAVDDLVQRFGPGQEQEGLAWIRANKSGEEEERLASAYKQRIGEMTIREVNADAELRKQQEANFDRLYRDYWSQDNIVPQEQLNAMHQNNVISSAQHRQGTEWNRIAVTRAGVTRKLSKAPDWSSLTPQQQEERIMRGMGVTKEDRESALAAIQAGVLDGTMTDAELHAYYKSGAITKSEEERFKKIDTQVSGEQKSFVLDQRKALSTDMDGLKIPGKDDKLYRNIALNKFNELVSQLDPHSKTYRMDVMGARRAAMTEAVQASGKKQADGWFFGFGEEVPTSFGERVSQALTALEEQTGRVEEYTPSFRTDEIDLSQNPQPAQSPTGNIGLDMVGGKGTITGRFDDWRKYPGRNGQHNGIDVAVPAGTPIVSPDFGVPLTVTRVVTGSPSKGGGNTVTLGGTLPDGRAISITTSHMQNGSIALKNGDVVQPGAQIGRVGNTGMTTDRSKGGNVTAWYPGKKSGHHLDVKVKIDGEYVDPEKVQLGPTREAAAKLEQERVERLKLFMFGGKDGI